MFTPAQYGRLNTLRRRAWLVECARTGTPPNNRPAEDRWYRDLLWSAMHVRSSKECNHSIDYDLTMLAFAVVANDDREISYWSSAAERRFVWLVADRLRVLGKWNRTAYDWSYVRGIFEQMHLPDRIEDVPAVLMRNVFIALDLHVKRRREVAMVQQDGGHAPVHERRPWSESSSGELPF